MGLGPKQNGEAYNVKLYSLFCNLKVPLGSLMWIVIRSLKLSQLCAYFSLTSVSLKSFSIKMCPDGSF